MIDITETEAGLYVVDIAKNELRVETVGWTNDEMRRPFPRHVHATVTGRASEFRFPEAAVNVENIASGEWRVLGNDPGPIRLGADDYMLKVNTPITAYLRFDGSARIHRLPRAEEVILRFPEPTRVTVGFRSGVRAPTGRITVPPTPAGVAAALPHLSLAIETSTPDRSYPSLRRHPPAIELGDELDVPTSIGSTTPETGIDLRVPDDLGSVFVVAPLAYYLQASVHPEPRDTARLEAPDADLRHDLGSVSDLQDEVAALLRRVFSLDCLVRNAGPYSADLAERSLLEELPFDAARVYDAPPGEVIAEYVETSFERIESEFPEWHLAMYVDPIPEHVPLLSHHLDRLAAIYLPDASPLEQGEFVKRSVNEGYRSPEPERGSTSVDPLLPELGPARLHGWMADGVPIDVFKLLPEAYDHYQDCLEPGDGSKRVRVVLNDPDMEDEQNEVVDVYERRAEELSIDVDTRRELDRDALADAFRTPADFVHYIGHCTERGLQCTDGYLSVAELDDCNVQTFFLNSCGSYREGVELIRKGSVAGAVTLENVLNRQATHVGVAFAQMIMHGFSVERALRLARRRSVLSKGYMAVGDGTYILSQGDGEYPFVVRVETLSSSQFIVIVDTFSSSDIGGVYQSYIPSDTEKHLFGNRTSFVISKQTLLRYLPRGNSPCIYDGEYYWSDELYDKLRNGTV